MSNQERYDKLLKEHNKTIVELQDMIRKYNSLVDKLREYESNE